MVLTPSPATLFWFPLPTDNVIIAIHKPTAITSAQVLRDLQSHLNPSKTFAPWIEAERQRRDAESQNQRGKRSRRSRQPVQVKMGHGGTLDPLATGVLIVGLGSGTKSLQGFLDGTKTYEAVVVFGAATDTYDSEGKIVKRAPYEHITKTAVQDALAQFRGDIMQRPPIFSALRVQGKRLYEYAREGLEVPVEIKKRPVTVSDLEVIEWLEPGTHEHNFPEEAGQEEKDVADKLLRLDETANKADVEVPKTHDDATADEHDLKRKRDEDSEASAEAIEAKKQKHDTDDHAAPTSATPSGEVMSDAAPAPKSKFCPAPAARIRMTVSSGFYVRSLCHDLGAAVDSLAFMSELARTRQSDFELGKNVLEYHDLAKGEDVWGSKVTDMLAEWNQKHPDGYERQSQPAKRQNGSAPKTQTRQRNSSSPAAPGQPDKQSTSSQAQKAPERQRNSSSPEA